MFEYIRLKNFKSLKDVQINLLDKHKKPKKLILIYGENGIGKSNIASSFFMLSETLRTMDVRDILETFLAHNLEKIENKEEIENLFKSKYRDIETIIKENKTVESKDTMLMEFGFRINDRRGKYSIETNDTQIIHEKLEYTLTKRRGTYIDITPDKVTINEKLFLNKDAYNTIYEGVQKFWGKHTFLSIVFHEIRDKADQYIKDKISNPFEDVLHFMECISCKIKFGSSQENFRLSHPKEILVNYEKGKIPITKEEQLNKTEAMLSVFLKQTNKDIEKVYYKKKVEDDSIYYNLMLSKKICGQLRDIDFSLESTGTQSMIRQLPFLILTEIGAISILDEFDTAIHDLLCESLVTSLYKAINGQLIMTTHNTRLMESNLPKDSLYIINELPDGNKEVECVLHYNNKIGDRNNIRDQYLLGKYSGIPKDVEIDFKKLLSILE
ncbi:ATP/GTP-binding protein [Lactobacillus intestinalis]|uniref:AAA family ATPase n=1 Tax=Lactobacillus intestinalis TaxID=151781 RepID=UPI0025B4AA4B|nr:AAA family ATPase [Lactobacillus intestinalis]